jgi:hypothetical protein
LLALQVEIDERIRRPRPNFGPPWSSSCRWLLPLLIVLGALGPIIYCVHAVRRRHRQLSNCCLVCGYDLRATPDQCPECGNRTVHGGRRSFAHDVNEKS